MKKLIVDHNIPSQFNRSSLIYQSGLTEAHHIIPWAICSAGAGQFPIFKRLAQVGWHASDPFLNGFVIPKKLPDGTVFHSQPLKKYMNILSLWN